MKILIKKLSNRWLFTLLLVAGMMFMSDMNAQQSQADYSARIGHLTTMQQTYAPGSAKYDLVGQAITYVTWVKNNVATNPDFLDGMVPLRDADQLRKIRPTILKTYTGAELAAFQTQYNGMVTAGDTSNPQFKKVQWIMDANAY